MVRAVAVVVAVAGCAGDGLPDPPPPEAFCAEPAASPGVLRPLEQEGFVAHAGGSPYGLLQLESYTNSREAFDVAYTNGFRAFEFDMVRLADGEVALAHDFDEPRYGLSKGFRETTRPELEGARWDGRYEILFGSDLIDLMVAHPDVWIILDTKYDHTEIAAALLALAPDDSIRDRMVPHLASEEHVAALAALYPFPERMIAVYRWSGSDQSQLERMARLGIDNIMMWYDSRWSEATQEAMESAGRHVWVHTPHEPAQLVDFRARGIGVYSDGWIACAAE